MSSNSSNGLDEPEDAVGGPPKPKSGRRRPALVACALVVLVAVFVAGRLTAPKSTTVSNTAANIAGTPTAAGAIGATQTTAPSSSIPSNTASRPAPGVGATGPGATGVGTVSLVNLTPVADGFDQGDKSPVLNGQAQVLALSASFDGCSYTHSGDAEYNLSRSFTLLTGLLGVDDNSADQSAAPTVEIDGDGSKLGAYTPTLGKPIQLSVNVTNVLRLTIKWSDPGIACVGNHELTYLVLGNGQLTTGPGYVATIQASATS
jgi:hypothetical protein